MLSSKVRCDKGDENFGFQIHGESSRPPVFGSQD